jgi:aminoglycoside phosphotransferase (APT) family kinase protein
MADEGPAAAGLTREQAAEILREALPGARVVGVERFAGGFEAGTYEVLCEDPLQNAVVKVYRKDDGWKLLKEISVYRLLGENAVTLTPKLLGGAGQKGALGLPYLVMGKLPGTTVGAISSTIPEAELADVYRQMGTLLAQLHAIGQEAYGYRTTEILDPQPTKIDVENAMAGDPVADLSKTHGYSIRDNRVKLDGFFEGYGEVPVDWERRFRLFQLIHAFELWGFFHGIGARDKLEPIAEEMRALITAS